MSNTWSCTDGNADVEIEADTAEEAAQDYVDSGDWGLDSGDFGPQKTFWVNIHCTPMDDNGYPTDEGESVMIEVNPDEPECDGDEDHDWQSPISIVGGLSENPGVSGHGGGVFIAEVCMRCGTERSTDTWAQDRGTGIQGLTSVEYKKNEYQNEVDDMSVEALSNVLDENGWVLNDGVISVQGDDDDDDDHDYDDETLESINALIGKRFIAEYTGNSSTDKYGDTTYDVLIEVNR